jgi:hypothetical protein
MITDGMMREIARKMASDYCEQLFWDHLPIIAQYVAEREGLDLKKKALDAGITAPVAEHGARR